MFQFEPDEITQSLFDTCDALMLALDAAARKNDKQLYDGLKRILVQTAQLIDVHAEGFKLKS